MILVTGASGTVGGAVLNEVVVNGVRAMYRSKSDAAKAPENVEVVIADFADKASLLPALKGVEGVLIVCAPIPQLVELEGNMIDASRAAGVRHVVLSSALGAGRFNRSFPSWHRQVEEKLEGSGLTYTILRPNGFMQNIVAYNSGSIRAESAFYAAMSDAKVSLVDVHDVGAVAAKVLLHPEVHANKTYELNGPEALSNADIAKRLSEVIGREIKYVDIPVAAQRKAMLDAGMPEGQVTAILELQEYYRSGGCAIVDRTVAEILGRNPRTLDEFLRENAANFQVQAASA
jgi:uncharacterized protein YbjT (DUF2867 family)